MNDAVRAFRRLTGTYVPYLEPDWSAEDFARIAAWQADGSVLDVREALLDRLRRMYPESGEVVLTDTGKTALVAAIKMLGLKSQDEVIVPSFCCSSVIVSVIRSGCTPVLADSDNDFNISQESVLEALSPRTKAIIVVHLYGLEAASFEGICRLARERGIAVIEDAAQAFGLRLRDGSLAGSRGDAAIFSSGPGKPIMGPGGGWALIKNPVAARPALDDEPSDAVRARVADFVNRFTGSRWRRGYSEIAHAIPGRISARLRKRPGFDAGAWAGETCQMRTMSAIDAWLANGQIDRIDRGIAQRRLNASKWRDLLRRAGWSCRLSPQQANIFTALPATFEGPKAPTLANHYRFVLESGGIATEPCYTPLHMRAEARGYRHTRMQVCETMPRDVFTLPVRPNLTERDWERIDAVVMGRASRQNTSE